MQLVEIFENYESLLGKEIEVRGWVKTCRDQKQMVFIHLSDGTTQKTLQIIVSPEYVTNMPELASITTGTSLRAKGILVKSPAKGQPFELTATEVEIYQICPNTFPFQKTGLPLEFMRQFPHLRHRSNIMRAVFVVKSAIMQAIHQYFTDKHYCLVDLPILTTNACEGGCQPLQVTALLNGGKISTIPVKTAKVKSSETKHSIHDDALAIDPVEIFKKKEVEHEVKTDDIDFSKDFFDNPVFLTVSNQLHLECFAHGLGFVYTITPATRGEPSQSTKHLASFSMLEWEGIFDKLTDNIDIAEGCIKHCVKQVLLKCPDELDVLDMAAEKLLLPKLKKIASEPFIRIEHRDAIKLLIEAHATTPFADEPVFAGDLSGEHERWLVKHHGQPVVVMRYPKAVKAFYMPVHHVVDGIEYVDCFDLLMDIGETVGASMRLTDEKELVSRMTELGIDTKHLDWYVDLRRFGTILHGGGGLGVERLTAVITGMANVKDCISFPLTVHHCTH